MYLREMRHNEERVSHTHVNVHKHTDTDQLCTRRTDGVLSRLSGNKSISFMIFASRTGSSCRRNVNDVFSQAFSEPGDEREVVNGLVRLLFLIQKCTKVVYIYILFNSIPQLRLVLVVLLFYDASWEMVPPHTISYCTMALLIHSFFSFIKVNVIILF